MMGPKVMKEEVSPLVSRRAGPRRFSQKLMSRSQGHMGLRNPSDEDEVFAAGPSESPEEERAEDETMPSQQKAIGQPQSRTDEFVNVIQDIPSRARLAHCVVYVPLLELCACIC